MRTLYVILVRLLGIAIAAQFFFAAVGAFDRPHDDDSYAFHSVNGMVVIPLLSIVATVVAALAKAPGRLIGMTILPLGLVVVQMLIIVFGNAVTGGADNATNAASLAIFGLHALNGMLTMVVVGVVARRAGALAKVRRESTTVSA